MLAGPYEFGTASKGAGTRTDISDLASDIIKGHGIKRLAQDHTVSMLRYFSNAQKLVSILGTEKRKVMTELYIYTGIAGTGKSHSAHVEGQKWLDDNGFDEEPYDLMVPSKKADKLWFQNYTGQKVVIIDDFYGTIDIDTFKRLIDR